MSTLYQISQCGKIVSIKLPRCACDTRGRHPEVTRMRRQRTTLCCEWCKETFEVFPCRSKTARFCSAACRDTSRRVPIEQQIVERVDRSAGPAACWPWTGSFTANGYGAISFLKKRMTAHRTIWEKTSNRTVPDGLVVRHLCPGGGNRWCCNPAHLALGTKKDNSQDMVRDGRSQCGERSYLAKLTWTKVREIRCRWANGDAQAGLAREYGVSTSTIHLVVWNRVWTSPPLDEPVRPGDRGPWTATRTGHKITTRRP